MHLCICIYPFMHIAAYDTLIILVKKMLNVLNEKFWGSNLIGSRVTRDPICLNPRTVFVTLKSILFQYLL